MTEWRVGLRGHSFDLAELSQRLHSPDLKVTEEDDIYYLTSRRFDSMTNSGEVLECAVELLARANGAMRIEHIDYHRVEAGNVAQRLGQNMKWDQFVHVSGAILIRSRLEATLSVVKADDSVESSAATVNPVQSWLEIAGNDVRVDRALRVLDSPKVTMAELYKALEIVEEDLGGEKALIDIGWAPAAEIKRFKQTVNSLPAPREDARHGKKFQAPKNPMTMPEGRNLVTGILKLWLQTKSE